MRETIYLADRGSGSRLEHAYGANVQILSDTWALSALARLGSPDASTTEVHRLAPGQFVAIDDPRGY